MSTPNISITTLLNQAVGLHQQGQFDAAETLYRQVLEVSPRQFDALHLLGVLARQIGQPQRAVDLITKAISIDATQAKAHCNLGGALQDLGRAQDALASYDIAIGLDPRYDMALCNRGNALRNLGRTEEALASYDRATTIRPNYPEAWCNRAIALQALDRPEEALASADRAIATRSNYADAFCARGNALQSLGRFGEALASYDSAIAVRNESSELHCCRGTALQRLQRFEEALVSYDRAITLRGDYPAAQHYRANTLRSLGRIDEAIAAYRTAQALGADATQVSFALAALGEAVAPASAPASYVTTLFDRYAEHFDQHLLERLDYQAPALIDAAIRHHIPAVYAATLDLGCGTGLCGAYLRAYSGSLTGVDLSPKMLEKAEQGGNYDHLACADIGEFLAGNGGRFDLIAAADVFVYFGDLAQVFALVHQALHTAGVFCFSLEECDQQEIVLRSSNRYAHSLTYLERMASEVGFELVDAARVSLRVENGEPVKGFIVVMRRGSDDLHMP